MLGRLDIVIQSVEDYLSANLTSLGVSGWRLTDAYPLDNANPLTETLIVVSSSQNDNPKEGEIGGPLILHRRRIMIDILARTEGIAQNLVALITEQMLSPFCRLPLLDFSTSPATPTGEYLRIDNCESARNYFTAPRPWQEHFHTVLLALMDEYNAISN